MLKVLMIIWGLMLGAQAYASSPVQSCMDSLQYHFLANRQEAHAICKQDSSAKFLNCMEQKAYATSQDISVSASQCSQKVKLASPYQTCEANMQIYARMSYDRAVQICHWDRSDVMQVCLMDLAQKARFHSEHAIQYCAFASHNYREKLPFFTNCVVNNSRQGYKVVDAVQLCHNRILGIDVPVQKPRPKPAPKPNPKVEVEVSPGRPVNPGVGVDPTPNPAGKVIIAPAPSTGGTSADSQKQTGVSQKVPTPVEIKVQESSELEILDDQPLDSGSTSNAESLPI